MTLEVVVELSNVRRDVVAFYVDKLSFGSLGDQRFFCRLL